MLLYPALKNHAYVMTSYIQQGDEILSILFKMCKSSNIPSERLFGRSMINYEIVEAYSYA